MTEQWILSIGTAILAILALFQYFIRDWLKTPKLEVATGSRTPFCKKLLFIHPNDPEKKADGYALRIKVKNVRPFLRIKTRAECVEVFALRLLKKQSDGTFEPEQEFEPQNLIWSHSFSQFSSISPEMERYCFIGRVIDPKYRHHFPDFNTKSCNMNETCLKIDVGTARHTKEHIILPGTYHLECLIGASNTKAFKKIFEVFISGEWLDDEIKMYETGLKIEML